MSGRRAPGWTRVIEQAQFHTHEVIGGKPYKRVKYGIDYPDGKTNSRDCGVVRVRPVPRLHLPRGALPGVPRRPSAGMLLPRSRGGATAMTRLKTSNSR